MSHVVKYGNGRFPVQIAKKKCRGCHSDVPKGRSTWCSNKCYDTYDPRRVHWFCRERDKFICFHCGMDAERIRKRFEHACKWAMPSQYSYFQDGVFQREQYDLAVKIWLRHERRWREAANKRITTLRDSGWPYNSGRDWWEMDHIIPFSEGGITILENVRTLCVLCHKKRTKKWRKEKSRPK